MMRNWSTPILFLICGLLGAGALFNGSGAVSAAIFLVAFLVLAVEFSPLIFPKSVSAPEARRLSEADGRPVVFWRPGCRYCIRLRFRLGSNARKLHWVNIWGDAEAAATVRAANEGNETVPTVFVSGQPHTNPDPAWVREQVAPAAQAG